MSLVFVLFLTKGNTLVPEATGSPAFTLTTLFPPTIYSEFYCNSALTNSPFESFPLKLKTSVPYIHLKETYSNLVTLRSSRFVGVLIL